MRHRNDEEQSGLPLVVDINGSSKFPLVYKSDLPDSMRAEVVELVVNCIENHEEGNHYFKEEKVANAIKVQLMILSY